MLDWLDAIQLRLNLSITGIHLLIDGMLGKKVVVNC